MAWSVPTLIEICIGLEINGYLPAEFWSDRTRVSAAIVGRRYGRVKDKLSPPMPVASGCVRLRTERNATLAFKQQTPLRRYAAFWQPPESGRAL
jgi:hypothetical protein